MTAAEAVRAGLFSRQEIHARKLDPAIDYPAYRRSPGGLVLAVLYAVGDGYATSLTVAALLETSIDNVNGALNRLERGAHVLRLSAWGASPVFWGITEPGRQYLRAQMWEGFE